MDTAIIFALVLSTIFLGALAWLVIYSRRQHNAAVRAQQPATPDRRSVRRPPHARR